MKTGYSHWSCLTKANFTGFTGGFFAKILGTLKGTTEQKGVCEYCDVSKKEFKTLVNGTAISNIL